MNTISKIQNFIQSIIYMAKARPHLVVIDCIYITVLTLAYCATFVHSYGSYTICVLMALIFALCADCIAAYVYWRLKLGYRF